ncbi:MAG: AMP-binding protein [Kofleriaceae bacterium]
MTAQCLADVFLGAVAAAPDRTCLHRQIGEHATQTTYLELARRVAGVIGALDRAGIGEGRRVVCFLDDVPDAILFALACAHNGVTAVPLDPRASTGALHRIVERTDAAAVFTRLEHADQLGALAVPALVWTPMPVPAGITNLRGEPPEVGDALAVLEARKAPAGSLYVIQPTSGTTGEPKLMLRTQRPFLRIGKLWSFPQANALAHQRRLMVHPLTHGTGVLDLWSGIAATAELCLPSRPNVEAPLDEVRALDPDVMTMVPRILRSLHRQQLATNEPPGTRLFGPSARVLTFGGAPCEPELQAMVIAQGVEVVEVYGTSETGVLVMTPPDERRPGWAGKPFDDVELKLDTDGELLARTPCMMEGYLGDAQQTGDSLDPDGFYRTGDYGELDAGWVKILGRKKDVFNTATGNNIFPARMEGMLEQLAGVQQAVLIGDARPFVTALLVLDHRDQLGAIVEQIRALNARLEDEERIRRLAVLDTALESDLYRSVGHGKVRRERKLIEERFAELVVALYAAPPPSGVVVV